MDTNCNPLREEDSYNRSRKIIMHPLYNPKLSPMLDLKVFYVRISNCELHESTPDHLTLKHIPLTPDIILEVNGRRSSIYSACVSSVLRRDRMDRRSEEATFVSTDVVRMIGSVKFEVYARDDMLLLGVLELNDSNGFVKGNRSESRKWRMKCRPVLLNGSSCFLKGETSPTIEVYVAGCFSGTPIILTKTLRIGTQKKHQMKGMLDSIPENESTELKKEVPSKDPLQISDYHDFPPESDTEVDYKSIYSRAEYFEGEDGELSWFNAGVRVGVGLGLGICLGIGVGAGLLVRTYQATTRNFKKRIF